MSIVQHQGKLFGLSISDEGSSIILGITEDGSMIEMCQHTLALASVLIIVSDSAEDETVVSVIDVVLVVRLRFEQGIARHLTVAFDAHSACIKEAVETDEFGEGGVGMLLNHLLDAVERGADFTIASVAGRQQDKEKKDEKREQFPPLEIWIHKISMLF